jgi:hypothetical protein
MTISKKATTMNLSESELIRQFDELKSQCATIVITLGTPPDAKHQIGRVRKLAAQLGPHMQKVARANLKESNSKTLCDPNVWDTLTEDDFLRELRKCIGDCLEQFLDTSTMPAEQRLKLLRRRLWMHGRRLELLAKACVVDRDELLRIIAQGEAEAAEAQPKLPQQTTVVPLSQERRSVAVMDEKTSRVIMKIGPKRVAFDFTSRLTELAPGTGDHPASVLPMTRKKGNQ